MTHCRDERISRTKEPLCTKSAQSVQEIIANACKNCGRPFVDEKDLIELQHLIDPGRD